MMPQRFPNPKRCKESRPVHVVPILTSPMCPVSGNPLEGSLITIRYQADDWFLEVISLRAYLDKFVGGFQAAGQPLVRSLEAMLQTIATDLAALLDVQVDVEVDLVLFPSQQYQGTFVGQPAAC